MYVQLDLFHSLLLYFLGLLQSLIQLLLVDLALFLIWVEENWHHCCRLSGHFFDGVPIIRVLRQRLGRRCLDAGGQAGRLGLGVDWYVRHVVGRAGADWEIMQVEGRTAGVVLRAA